ncbi:MAG: kelch repeat-containing protein [Ignavibacteriaceae bacterium]
MKSKIYSFALMAIIVLSLDNLNFAQWTQRTAMPTARSFAASCELYGKIYVIGGGTSVSSSMNKMEVYDPATDTWDTSKADMPTARAELCAVAFNGKIYAIGGATSHNGYPSGIVEVYDGDDWKTNKAPMPTPRKGAAVGVIDNKIYVAGGSANSNYSPSNKLKYIILLQIPG